MKKSFLLFSVLLFLVVFPLFPQEFTANDEGFTETETPPPSIDELSVIDDDLLYIITAFEFDIKGRSRPSALIKKGEFHEGEELKGQANLEKYIHEKTQLLINQRILKDNAEIDYSIGEQREDGAYPVTLYIKVEDSWNIIALPRPAYKSDTGFDLTIKARDYNFLGTMNPLRIDLGYQYDENKHSSFMIGVFSDIPFRAFGFNWNIIFNNTFSYRPQVSEPFYYQHISGLSMEMPVRSTTFTFGFEESVTLNEENEYRYQPQYGEFQSGPYMASRLYTSWEIPTGLMVSRYGELIYTPTISTTFNHEFSRWPLQEIRKGPFMGFSHSLGFEKIDWHSNYREGLSVFINNSFNYDFFRLTNDKTPLSITLELNGIGHFIISKFFAISSRLMYRYWFYHDPDYYDQAANALRGIADKAISADHMLSLNMDFPLRVLVFSPSKWLHNEKFRFFDFELQISPVIDIGLYHDPKTGTSFSFKNTAVSGGLEFMIFPDFMRNLYVRFGYALNLRELFSTGKFPGGNNREIYFIMGHFY